MIKKQNGRNIDSRHGRGGLKSERGSGYESRAAGDLRSNVERTLVKEKRSRAVCGQESRVTDGAQNLRRGGGDST